VHLSAEFAPEDGLKSSSKVEAEGVGIAPVIPHTSDAILPVVDDIVNRFWECRRYGERWDCGSVPAGFFDDCGGGTSVEAAARRAHRRLMFDLIAETITEIYRHEDDSVGADCFFPTPAKVRPKPPEAPTTLDLLKPRVEAQVLRQLKLRDAVPLTAPRWSSRRKQDMVDRLLVKELGHEEPGWVDYSTAEFDVKTQIVDSLMELLLNDTAQTVQQAMRFRQITVD